jgi:penicillin-binding protein 1A
VARALRDDWGADIWARTWRVPSSAAEPERSPDTILPSQEPVRPPEEPASRSRAGPAAVTLVAAVVAAAAVLVASVLPVVGTIPAAIHWVDRHAVSLVAPIKLPRLPERSTIYAADGSVLVEVYKGYDRQEVPLRRINRVTRRAVLAAEDHSFYRHGPLDFASIIRAAVVNLRAGRIVQGGSTITQQLAKDLFTGSQVTLHRKLEEAGYAIRLERTYSKRRILAAYLNEVFLGHSVYGVAAAAEYYFGVPVQDVTLPQAALLGGMIASPNRFNPIDHPDRALARRDYVLGRMRALGWIGQRRLEWAVTRPLGLSDRMRSVASPGPNSWWTQFVTQEFLSDPRFGPTYRARAHALFRGGLRIYTTLDSRMERAARAAIRDRMRGPGLPQSALVSVVPSTGAVTAMALGRWDFGPHRYNLAVDPGGGRTAGSSFKVFTLAAALEQGIPPWKVYNGSSPTTIPNCGGGETWTVHNAEPGSGSYPLWMATVHSVNAVFARVIDEVGPAAVARVAHRMGVTTPLVRVCPLTLGTSPVTPLDMTSAVSTLANGGVHCEPYGIAEVVFPTGETVVHEPECSRGIPADVAAEETAILEDVIRFGTGWRANIGRPAAGKTGTGQEYQDAWFIGYVPQLATGVWVGYARAELPMPAVPGYGRGYGGVLAAPIWHDFMYAATKGMLIEGFPGAPIPFEGSPTPTPSPTVFPAPTEPPP